jgi:hypothetical protein
MKTHNVGKKYSPVTLFKFLLILVSVFTACSTYAATLNVTAPSSSYPVGGSFTVTIIASSSDRALNAVDGAMSFPSDKLEVLSLSKEGSILSLWTEEPSYSNSAGSVKFSGVALNPGYTGSSGRVLKVNFRVKKSGSAALAFSSGSILANDGQGTNILTSLNSTQLSLTDGIPVSSVTPVGGSKPGAIVNSPKKDSVVVTVPPPSVVTPLEQLPIMITSEKPSGPIIPSEILHLIKTIFIYASILALLLFVLGIVYVIVLYVWHRVVIIRIKMKSETREVSASLYQELRLKVDKDFSAGDYLSALSGYRKLQEQAPSVSQPELADRISITTKFFAAKDNLKRAQSAVSREKWLEARILLEENEYMNDPLFAYRNDAQLLAEKVKLRLAEIGEESKSLRISQEKKVVETAHMVEETKSELIYQQGLLAAERAKREQAEEAYKNASNMLKEKENEFESRLKDAQAEFEVRIQKATLEMKNKESSFEQSLNGSRSNVEARDKKLEEVLRQVEEAKIAYLSEHALLVAEQTKNAALIEESNRVSDIARDREVELENSIKALEAKILQKESEKDQAVSEIEEKLKNIAIESEKKLKIRESEHEKEIEEAKAEVSASVYKVTKVEATVAELKERLLEEHNQFLEERAKVDRIKEDAKKLNSLFKEKEAELIKESEEARSAAIEADKKISSISRSLDDVKAKLADEQAATLVEKNKRVEAEDEAQRSALSYKAKISALEKQVEDLNARFDQAISEREAKFKEQAAALERDVQLEKEKTKDFLSAVTKYISPK